MFRTDQPRGLVVRVSDYWSWGPGFDSRFYHRDFSLKGKIPMVTMVWVVQYNLGLRPLLVLHIHISPSTSSGQRNCASWGSQPQKSVTLRPQPGGETTKSKGDMGWYWAKNCFEQPSVHLQEDLYMHEGNTIKLHLQVFLRMKAWLFETCWKQYNWIKLLMKKVCILVVRFTYVQKNP
jgi:hypothetical protein